MAFKRLNLDPNAPKEFRDFIHGQLEMMLHDVHTMMRLPVRAASGSALELEEGLDAGCNFAAVNMLLTVISGISTLVYPSLDSGKRFKTLLEKFYPWDKEASPAPEKDSEDIYKLFRNPLAHALGVATKSRRGGGVKRAASMGVAVIKSGLPEDLVERLEQAPERPDWAAVTIGKYDEGRKDIHVDALYWGVRVMIERISSDPAATQSVVKFLA